MGAKLMRAGFNQTITANHEAGRSIASPGRKPISHWLAVAGVEGKTTGRMVAQQWKRACLPCRRNYRSGDGWR